MPRVAIHCTSVIFDGLHPIHISGVKATVSWEAKVRPVLPHCMQSADEGTFEPGEIKLIQLSL